MDSKGHLVVQTAQQMQYVLSILAWLSVNLNLSAPV